MLRFIKHLHIVYWLRGHFNKHRLRLMREAWRGGVWDYTYIVLLLRAKIDEMQHYFDSERAVCEGARHRAQQMRLAIRLINIMFKDELFTYNHTWDPKKSFDENMNELADRYECKVKVNTKNIDRFIPDRRVQEFVLEHPHELYLLKAKHLFFKCLEQNLFDWWD